MSNYSVRGQLIFCGVLIVAVVGGFTINYFKQEKEATRVLEQYALKDTQRQVDMLSIIQRIDQLKSRTIVGLQSTSYSEIVTCNGRSVTVSTTCPDEVPAAACWAQHQASVEAARSGLGCR